MKVVNIWEKENFFFWKMCLGLDGSLEREREKKGTVFAFGYDII